MIPLQYTVGSVWARKETSLASMLAIALVVFVIAGVLMLQASIESTFGDRGQDDMAIVIRRGSMNESNTFDASTAALLLASKDVKTAPDGAKLGVAEVVVSVSMRRAIGQGNANVRVRGVPENVFAVRPNVHVTEGRPPRAGIPEAIVGRSIRGRFPGFDVGKSVEVRTGRTLQVVGVFEDSGSNFESELWTDIDNVRSFFALEGLVSSVRARLVSPSTFDSFKAHVESDKRLGLVALRETTYYQKLSEGLGRFVTVVGTFLAIFFSAGAMIGAMVTMYASVANRQRELGTLRALGFPRRAILGAILLEAATISLVGGVLGCLAAVALGRTSFSMANFSSFQEVVLKLEPRLPLLGAALGAAVAMGVVGGFTPAVRAALIPPVKAMRNE